jgi:hypothetical protein
MARSRSLALSSRFGVLSLTGSLLLACTGQIGDFSASGASSSYSGAGPGKGNGGGNNGSGATGSIEETIEFKCDPDARPPVDSLRRLTMGQLKNTVRDLLNARAPDVAEPVLDELASAFEGLPNDRREPVPMDIHGSYRRLDQSMQQLHVDAIYALGIKLGKALTTADRMGSVVGECAVDEDTDNDDACLDEFITRFGERALRRPITEEDITFYRGVYGSDTISNPEAYADVIAVMANSPEFLYFVEHGDEPVEGQPGVFQLGAYELASRLAYQLWQTSPDDELYALAADGSLLEPSTYEAQVLRMIEDPRAKPALQEFYEDWMKVQDLPALDAKVNDPLFRAFAGDDLPGPTLRQSMIEDVVGLFDYYTWNEPSPLAALFSTEKSFAKSRDLAAIYGVSPWDGESEPPDLPTGQRPGFLTRALFLTTGSANTRPIMKGVFIRKHILCDDIPPPPAGANAKPPELRPDMTTREVVEELTETGGTVCAGCHINAINPLGFATENFDALGRFRTEQQLFDEEGNLLGSKPVDTSVIPRVSLDDDTPTSTPGELMSLLAESGKVEACLARNFFRYTFARWEDKSLDACALEELRVALESGSLRDLLRVTATSKAFRVRSFE